MAPHLLISTFDDPTTLDPHRAYESTDRHPVLNMYDSLLALDTDGTVRPAVGAELPTIVERGAERWVTIPVRDGVRFHDGSRLTPDDVVYSLRRGIITATSHGVLWSDALLGRQLGEIGPADAAEMLARVQPTGEGVLLRLARPFAPLPALLVQWSLVVSRQWCARRGEWDGDPASAARYLHPVRTALDAEVNGTGPYTLDSWDPAERRLTFRRHPGYWADPPQAATVTLRSEDDRIRREDQLLCGDSDFSVCQPESRDRLGELRDIVLETLPDEWCITPLGYLTQRLDPGCPAVGTGDFGQDGIRPDAFTDVHLRRALTLCFDHDRYTREVLDGASLDHRVPFPAGVLPADRASRPVYDPAAATRELGLAWGGAVAERGCRIVIYTHKANISRTRAAELLRDGLVALSPKIRVEIAEVDLATLVGLVNARQAPVAWSGWAGDFLHPYAFVSALVDPRGPLPIALGIDDPRLATLSEAVRDGIGDPASNYREIAELVRTEALYLCPPGKVSYMTYRRRWTGVRLKNQVPNVLDFASFRLRPGSESSPP
ncbi:MAG TPA: ABC transporter substrate-binding protein [Actinophytocola sp.]|uniref:ABC transporter substrate-binding protein n=1 Tax=Actinophytocola sp. TaxID=1872138 RepID=UPI002DDCC6B6|nr:ABC transporter substrate-binding protein [Actinophytocola sp.]HEV2780510.1 ABC transporter substrate-binding protein [Actinophytocola sp.]